jgi:hypothetical protein
MARTDPLNMVLDIIKIVVASIIGFIIIKVLFAI